ncbi:DUF2065 domain-containing protein [Desulfonatronovibrio magnus]|uniref:DUF2065 domain-containing protein n=1 Tax=Desulfonatronovibrio magnus TaxID=698827 RepID=UPI0005EB08C5|nr:DUF2065 domain-containing protein [Desulfonatronovibrio magnus]
MQFDFSLFITALGLAFVIEGLPYFIWAEKMPRFLEMMSKQPTANLRRLGFTAIILGILVIFFGRSL